MRRIVVYIICLVLVLTLLLPLGNVKAASNKTLRDYKNEVANLESKIRENNRLTKESEASIDAKRNAILAANNKIAENEENVEKAKQKVEESKVLVAKKTDELQDVISVLQYANSNFNQIYIDYVFEADSISELMERQAVIEQIANYTQEQLLELDALIKENEELQVTLANETASLNNSISSYEKQVENLRAYIDSLATIGLDYADQVKAQKNLIKIFENAGCKDSDYVQTCYYDKQNSSGLFIKPVTSAVITQAWGNNGHKGMDLGGMKKGANVYATASGTVIYVQDGPQYMAKNGKRSCGGNIIYIHSNVNGQNYTTEYAHLTSYAVSAGQRVNQGQVIGTVGGDSSTWWYDRCTTGIHLHYSIAYGYWLSPNGYYSWDTFLANTKATSVQSISGILNKKGVRW